MQPEHRQTSEEALRMLDSIHARVQPIVVKANTIFISGFFQNSAFSLKESGQLSTSVITETDTKLDKLFREEFSAMYPNIGLITEEEEGGEEQEYNWIVDPLDGTANFAHKIRNTGISIALWRRNTPVYGLLSFPLEHEIVYAVSGNGAFYKGERISFEHTENPKHLSVLFAGIGENEEKLNVVRKMLKVVPWQTDYRSSAYHFKLLVLRRADIGVFYNMPIWDIAAGVLVAKEAGLTVQFIETTARDSENLRDGRYTVVVGQQDIVSNVAEQLEG